MASRGGLCYRPPSGKRAPRHAFSSAGPTVKLLVDRLRETPSSHSYAVTPAWWAEVSGLPEGGREGIGEGLTIELEAYRLGDGVFLEGEVRGQLDLECSRCLARYRPPIRERFRLVLEPAGDRVPADPEGAAALARDGLYLPDELETGWFRGSEIELGAFFREVISLMFPVQPLCREDCRGLCPRCGADRNAEACSCPETRPPSPFEALRGLRVGGGDER